MKRLRISKSTIGYSAIALLLALSSLPNLPGTTATHNSAHVTHWPHSDEAMPTVGPLQTQPAPVPAAPGGTATPTPTNPEPLYRVGKLRVRVIDGRTMQPLANAEVVMVETEQRLTTNADGYTGWFDAPILRNPRYRPMVAELHGQLGVIAYKNGYRDSVHLGIRIPDVGPAQATVWMYQIGPGDRRIEPVLYEEPYHHLWLIELADRFRSKSQPGEGPQRP